MSTAVKHELTNQIDTALLKHELARDVKELSKLRPPVTYVALVSDWAIIFGIAEVSVLSGSWIVYLLAVLVIAGRQHALFVLTHEGAHRRISNNSLVNDLLSDLLIAFPIFLDTKGYRENHMQHHLYLNTERDPDWVRKMGRPEWSFPMSNLKFYSLLARYAVGLGITEWWGLMTKFSGFLPLRNLRNPKVFKKAALRLLYYAVVISIVSRYSHPSYLLTYWLTPYVFVMLVFQRIRSVAEHFGVGNEHELNQSRNVIGSHLENLFIGTHGTCLPVLPLSILLLACPPSVGFDKWLGLAW